MKLRIACLVVGFLSFVLSIAAQTASSGSPSFQVPPLIQFSNVASDEGGNSLSGLVNLTFTLYNSQQGGQPLWMETQNNVQLDPSGHYSVQLGITKANGVPTTLFTTGEARWLGVRIAQQPEQPRVLLLSVPYALKAGDAATIGGLPPSAFVLAAPGTDSATSSPTIFTGSAALPADAPPASDVTGSGTTDFIPLWTSTSNIGNSVLFQKGTGSTAKIGINTITPATTLDIKGSSTVRGTLSLPATGSATATAGKNSQPLNLAASAFNSTSSTAINQTFQWQAEPAGNDTSTPSGTLNLLFGEGATKPSETGLNIASNGQITFATGQTFPGTGTGDGTVTSVGSGAGLAGGPITGSGTLSIASAGVTNAMLANPSLTVTAGTDLTGGGLVALGNGTTLSLDTTKVPQLSTANTFQANQTVNGNLTATNLTATQTVSGGVVNATTSFDIQGSPFAFGSNGGNVNEFVGFAGNFTMTGTYNTASGYEALYSNATGFGNTGSGANALQANTTGSSNTATGFGSLTSNTTGGSNTASGAYALYFNTTGSSNTASGFFALTSNTTGGNNTASGYYALISNTTGSSNTASGEAALFDNTTGVSNTASGYEALYSNTTANGNTASGNQALYSNTTGASNTADGGGALYSNSTGHNNIADGLEALYSNTTGYENTAVGGAALYSNTTGNDLTCIGYDCTAEADGLSNATAIGAHAVVGASNSLVLGGTGAYAVKVGIGTATPSSVLTIAQGAGHPVSDGWETFSSRRWKTNIQTLHGALGKVEQLRGVSYDLKANGKHEVGVIAEEVGAVVPELVSYEENGKDARSVDYSRLTALLIEAVKQQQREIRDLKSELRATRQTLQKVQARVTDAQPALVAAK